MTPEQCRIDTYNCAINIIAVEYLVKQKDVPRYSKECNKIYKLDNQELDELHFILGLNMHIGNLGEMITHDSYDYQRDALFRLLNEIN